MQARSALHKRETSENVVSTYLVPFRAFLTFSFSLSLDFVSSRFLSLRMYLPRARFSTVVCVPAGFILVYCRVCGVGLALLNAGAVCWQVWKGYCNVGGLRGG